MWGRLICASLIKFIEADEVEMRYMPYLTDVFKLNCFMMDSLLIK